MCSESQTLDSKVTAEIGLSHIDMFDLDVNIVDLAIALLCSDEFATGAKEGGCVIWQKLRMVSGWLVACTPARRQYLPEHLKIPN